MNHDEIDESKWRDKKDKWVDYVKNDILCTAFSYARYSKTMEEITRFSMKGCLSLPELGWKYFISLKTEKDEPIYTNNDIHMRSFARQSIKEGRVCAFNIYCKSKICDNILKILSEELNVTGNNYDIIEGYLNYKNKLFKNLEKEYENQFNDYRAEDI